MECLSVDRLAEHRASSQGHSPVGPGCGPLVKVHLCSLLSSFVRLKKADLQGGHISEVSELVSIGWCVKPPLSSPTAPVVTGIQKTFCMPGIMRNILNTFYLILQIGGNINPIFQRGNSIENPSTSKWRVWDLNPWAPPPAHLTSVLGFYGQSYEVLTTLCPQKKFYSNNWLHFMAYYQSQHFLFQFSWKSPSLSR